MIVYEELVKDSTFTDKEIQEIEALNDRPIVFEEDSPEITEEMASGFKRVHPKREMN